jgi:cytochrome o ubiquinol oxidase subunit 3
MSKHQFAAPNAGNLTAQYFDLDEHDHPEGGSTMLGFWIYLMSDCLIFAMLFAAYGVLGGNYAAGPGPRDLFELPLVAVNTAMLLFSSITYGFAMIAMQRGRVAGVQGWLMVTALFGAAFLSIELYEFSHLIADGATPQLHVTFGLIWLGTLLVQLAQNGLTEANKRRLMCLSMFWHFLDVVWVGVFTFVYLMGVLR